MPVAAKDLLPGHARAAPTTAEVVRMRAGVTTFRSLCWRGLDAVPAEVTTHAALEKLWLHNNELRRLPREMASLSGLRVLTLSHNRRLGDGCWAVIERLLRLETLEVGGNAIGDAGAKALRRAEASRAAAGRPLDVAMLDDRNDQREISGDD